VQGAAAETVVRRAVLVRWVARHCSRRWVEEVDRSIGGHGVLAYRIRCTYY
jgi:hypothetical protein